MRNEYRREMDDLGPRPEELERLYEMIEGGTSMKQKKRLGVRAAVALVCAALMVTAAAAAAVPAVWESLTARLGAFAPYAQTIEGVKCADQGIEVQVLSAISDDLEARVYLSVRDVEQDRLNEFLKLSGILAAGEAKDPEAHAPNEVSVVGGFSSGVFDLISYDPATKTALLSTTIYYLDSSRPNGEARLSVTGMSTREATLYTSVSCASVTGAELDSLPAGEGGKVIFEPGWLEGGGADNSVLPAEHVVLAPDQTPTAIEGTEDMRISSMGFASDGCFHIRLEFADGVEPATYERVYFDWESGVNLTAGEICSQLYCDLLDGSHGHSAKLHTVRETLVEGGMDILFPLITTEDLEDLQGWQARVYGTYLRPGSDVEGDWSTTFELDYYPSVTLDWTGEADGWQVHQVTVSPLSVTTQSSAFGQFHDAELHAAELYAVKKDGSTVAAKAGTSSYSDRDALAEINGEPTDEPKGWEAFNTWRFEEPVDVEDIVSLMLGGTTIPVN